MAESSELPTEEELAKLPRLAIVAYAVRCAQRVQPLFLPWEGFTLTDWRTYVAAIDRGVALAASTAAGNLSASSVRVAAATDVNAAANAAKSAKTGAADAAETATNATNAAFTRATSAKSADAAGATAADAAANANGGANAEGDAAYADTTNAAYADYRMLLILRLAEDATIDVSERGPLGPLWPDEPPVWYTAVLRKQAEYRRQAARETGRDNPLIVEGSIEELPTHDELARLPRRAIVAFAVRCAQRVQPLFLPGMGLDLADWQVKANAIDDAIALAAAIAGKNLPAASTRDAASADRVATRANSEAAVTTMTSSSTAISTFSGVLAARASALSARAAALAIDDRAATLAASAASLASISALVAATDSARGTGSAAFAAHRVIGIATENDRHRLLELRLGQDDTVDISETGPLGSLWPDGPPEWYTDSQRRQAEHRAKADVKADTESPIAGPLTVYVDSDAYTDEEKGELLSLISDLYSLQSGDRLVIDHKGTAEPVPVTSGGPNTGGTL